MKNLLNKLGLYGFAFMVVAVVMLATGIYDHAIMTKKPIDITKMSCDWSKLNKNDHIVTDINFCMGEAYTEVTTEKTYGIKTKEYESGMAYLIPHINEDEEGLYFDGYMIMFVKRKADYAIIDRVTDASIKFYNGEIDTLGAHTYHAEGKLVKLKKDEEELLRSILIEDLEYTDKEVSELMVPYKFAVTKDSFGSSMVIAIILAVVGGILLAINFIKVKKEREMEEMIALTKNVTVSNDDDFMSADSYNSETGRYESSNNDSNFN